MDDLRARIKSLEYEALAHWLPIGRGGKGYIPVRQWENPGAPKVVLMHGGSGSWLHWFRNIHALAEHYDVYAIDLPGLGDAAMCPVESDAFSAAEVTRDALTTLIDDSFHIVAFSWGCTVTALLMKTMASQLRSVMMTGPAAVGDLPRRVNMKPLIRRTPEMSREEVLTVQRENLARLMIHDREKIDEMAVLIQDINTSKARFSSPRYARSTLLIDHVRGTSMPLLVIYGDHDAPAYPELKARRQVFLEVREDTRFELVEDAGHWLQYERSDVFNERCLDWLSDAQ